MKKTMFATMTILSLFLSSCAQKEVKNEDENDVLFYRYVKGLRFWEIAEKMDCSEQWVHKLHGRALAHLKLPT